MDISSTSPLPLVLNHHHAPISFLLRFHSLASSLFPLSSTTLASLNLSREICLLFDRLESQTETK
jgi:hypothetical protein